MDDLHDRMMLLLQGREGHIAFFTPPQTMSSNGGGGRGEGGEEIQILMYAHCQNDVPLQIQTFYTEKGHV